MELILSLVIPIFQITERLVELFGFEAVHGHLAQLLSTSAQQYDSGEEQGSSHEDITNSIL